MNVHSFVRGLQAERDLEYGWDVDSADKWSRYMAKILHRIKDRLALYCCCHMDEHKDATGTEYTMVACNKTCNVMTATLARKNKVFDIDQCANINQDLPSQVLRGDP